MPNLWLDKIERDGVRLTVEVDLSFDQFRELLADGLGGPVRPSNDQVVEMWHVVNRRILPTDAGSFSGIGHDVNQIIQAHFTARGIE
jgi:hypothetical protein